MGVIIGIDLGTTNSVVSVMDAGEAEVITNAQGARTTPSVVAFRDDGERLVGTIAKRQAVQNPENTIFSIKRFMGRRHEEVGTEEKMVPYKIVGGTDDLVKVQAGDKEFTPPEISAMVLQNLKESAEEYLGEKVTQAVITVPAYFNDAQRQATKDAGTIAGLEVKRIINEPTAAALAFGLDKNEDQIIAVFDLGGGTFDVSILELSNIDDKDQVFEVKATNGDTHLGGDDFDEILINHVADGFMQQHGIDLRKDPMALQRLKDSCEQAKCELSTTSSTSINQPFITQDANKNPIHLNQTLSRAKFEQLCEPLFARLIGPCKICLEDAGISASQIDEVVLVGGSSRIPKVQEIVMDIFGGKEPNKTINPDEVVSIGAAVQGAILADPSSTNITFLDVTPLSLGVEIEGGMMVTLIEKNTTIPADRKEVFTTASDMQSVVDVFVYQGERPVAKDNRLLDTFKLTGIPPAPRSIPKIEVAFDIDVNGILKVTAKDLGTGKEHNIVIESSSGLSKDDIKRMVEEAEKNADADAQKQAELEERNQAENLAYVATKFVEEHGEKISEPDKEELIAQVAAVRKALENNTGVAEARKTLETTQSRIAMELYKNAGAAPESTEDVPDIEAPGDAADVIDVIDVDYVPKSEESTTEAATEENKETEGAPTGEKSSRSPYGQEQ